jgi:O-antigen ligase
MSAIFNRPSARRFFDSEFLLLGFVLFMAMAGFISIAISQMCLGISLLLLLYRRGVRKVPLPRTGLELGALLLAAWALLNIFFSTDVQTSIIFYRRFFLFSAIWVVAAVINTEHRRFLFLLSGLIGALAISLFGEIQSVIQTGSLFTDRFGAMSNPMTSGSLLMMMLLVGMGFLLAGGHRRWFLVILPLVLLPVLLGTVLTMTRSVLLGVAGGIGVMVLLSHRRWFFAFLLLLLVLVILVLALGESILPARLYGRMNLDYLVSGRNTVVRLEMWQGAWEMVKAKPIFGFGDRNLLTLVPEYYGDSATNYYGHMHSNFVQLAVIWGIPGLFLGLFFIFMPLILLVRRWKDSLGLASHLPVQTGWILGAIGMWTGFFLAGFTEWYFGDAETMLIYLAFLGCALAPSLSKPKQPI